MEIELSALLNALKKLFWVPLLLVIVFGLVGYTLADRQVRTYTATSTIVLEQSVVSSAANTSASRFQSQLSDTYKLLLDTRAFREKIATEANVENIDEFEINITAPAGSTLVNIQVTHTDATAALAVANATVDVIILDHAGKSEERLGSTTKSLNDELELLNTERNAQAEEMSQLEANEDTASARYRELSNSVLRLDQRITDTEARIDRMRLDYQLSEPAMVPIKYVNPPTTPNNLSPVLGGMLGALLGGLVGAAIILFWALINNVVHNASEWQSKSDTRILSEISHAGQLKEGSQQVFILTQPTASPAEGIRMLVTGLEFASFPDENQSVLQVTSPGPSDGKSTVSSNLAVHYAQLGKRVVLIDCDLHRPTLHNIFNVPNDIGLTSLLIHRDTRVQDVAARVALPGLFFIPTGQLAPNAAELFSSVHFANLLKQLKVDFDVVILDTPPILLFSDSHRIASRSDAVVAVGRYEQTKAPAMVETVEAIQKTGTEFLGTIWVGSRQAKNHYYYRERRSRKFSTRNAVTARLLRGGGM